MKEERGNIDGDVEVLQDTRLYGRVSGSVTVMRGRLLVLHGTVEGTLYLEPGSRAHVYGTVVGDVINGGSELRVWRSGTIRGTLHRGSAAKVESGAKVRALAPPEVAPTPMSSSAELTEFRVLIVEDDDATRDELTSLLRSSGADPVAARDGVEAFESFVRERPDAIVSDLWMPNADGYQLIKRVRSLSPEEGRLTPAIAMTAASGDSDERALMAGFHAHLVKPFDPSAFLERVRAFHDANAMVEEPGGKAARWRVTRASPSLLVLAVENHVRARDMRDGIGEIVRELEEAPATVILDAREATAVDFAVGSVIERGAWKQRGRILRVIVVSSARSVRLIVAAACATLGVPCTATNDLPPEVSAAPKRAMGMPPAC